MSKPRVEVFTDGACSGNPGPGGWGAILRSGLNEREISGGEILTTNNRMEIMAAIRALEALKKPAIAIIHTDSRYLMDGITKWLPRWKAKGWRTAGQQTGQERRTLDGDWRKPLRATRFHGAG